MKVLVCLLLILGCKAKDVGESSSVSPTEPLPITSPSTEPAPVSDTPEETPDEMVQLGPNNTGDVDLVEIPELPAVGIKLIGGKPADRKDWPASFTTSQGNSRCTGTMLSDKVLQLAAHCVGNGRSASVTSGGKKYTGKCTHSPNYSRDATADYALCLMSEPLDLPWYESIMIASGKIKEGDKLLLAGMGCTQPGGGGGSNDVFRTGEATVVRLPVRDNDIVTKGDAALCFGDSGGSAFWKDEKGVYKIAGVNSRGDIRKVSYLSAVFTKNGNEFYASWAVKNNVKICGLSESAEKCRGAEAPGPDPVDPMPEWCKESMTKLDKCIFGKPPEAQTDVEGCRDSFAKLSACLEIAERVE